MFVLGSLLVTLGKVLSMILSLYTWVILGAVVVSWVGADPYNPIVRFLRQVTDPLFNRIRRYLPRSLFRWGVDFSPFIALILLMIAENFIVTSLLHYGAKMARGG